MSADGTYNFVYSREDGVGIGAITIQNNILKGTDLYDVDYNGVVSELPNATG